MTRAVGWNYNSEMIAQVGELTVVDFAYHMEGRPVGSPG